MILKRFFQKREFALFTVCIALYTFVGIIQPKIFSLHALFDIFLGMPVLLLVALGEMGEIVSQNVDVSLGSVLGFSAVIAGLCFIYFPGIPLLVVFLISMITGGVLCAVNGLLVRIFKLPSVIITLGTMNLYRGLLFIILNNRIIDNTKVPRSLVYLSTADNAILVFPITLLIVVAIAIVFHFFLTKMSMGRQIYAVGDNEVALKLRGINTDRVVIGAFTVSGILTGLAAMFYLSRVGYVTPSTVGVGLEFNAVAAVVIGGTSMKGGSGSVLGVCSGCLLLSMVNNSVSYLGISPYWQNAAYGLIIIIAVLLELFLNKRRVQKVGMAYERNA